MLLEVLKHSDICIMFFLTLLLGSEPWGGGEGLFIPNEHRLCFSFTHSLLR